MPPEDGRGAVGRVADHAVFAAQFVRAPMATASVWPSSSSLARVVADTALAGAPSVDTTATATATASTSASASVRGRPVVVELGAGSGAFTSVLARRLDGRGRHLAVEINPVLAHRLADRCPGVEVVPADVAELPTLLALRGLRGADAVVSGLGWSATRPGRPDSLLPTVVDALADDGVLVQLAYTFSRWAAPARALRAELDDRFTEVTVSPVVWRNLPPAVVYRARRPRR